MIIKKKRIPSGCCKVCNFKFWSYYFRHRIRTLNRYSFPLAIIKIEKNLSFSVKILNGHVFLNVKAYLTSIYKFLTLSILCRNIYCVTKTKINNLETFQSVFIAKIGSSHPVNIYLFKVDNRNTKKRCEICSKVTIKTPEQCQGRRSCVFIVNFEHILHLFLVFLLSTLNK